MKLLLYFTVLAVLVYGRDLGEILFGEDVPTCKRTRDELQTQCVTNYFENYVRPILVKGVPLEGFPGLLDPFVLDKIPITIVKPGLDIEGYATNAVLKGIGDSIIKKVRLICIKLKRTDTIVKMLYKMKSTEKLNKRHDYEYNNFEVKVTIPMLTMTCNYSVAGSKIVFFSLETKGMFQGTFVNVEADITGRMDTHIYNGMEFALANDMIVNLAYGSGTTVRLTPADSGLLSKFGVSLINYAPARAVLYMFRNEIKSAVSRALEDKTDEILAMLPLKLVFD